MFFGFLCFKSRQNRVEKHPEICFQSNKLKISHNIYTFISLLGYLVGGGGKGEGGGQERERKRKKREKKRGKKKKEKEKKTVPES